MPNISPQHPSILQPISTQVSKFGISMGKSLASPFPPPFSHRIPFFELISKNGATAYFPRRINQPTFPIGPFLIFFIAPHFPPPRMSGSYLFLAEFVLAFLFHSISVGRILLILRAKFHSQRDTSLYFMALLINWLIAALLLLPYEAYGISIWRPQPNLLYNGQLLFFIAMPCHVFLAMIPVSVFFLTFDRICIIYFGGNYGRQAKLAIKWCYFAALVICLAVNVTGFFSALPVPLKSDCEIFGCILGPAVQFYLGWRAFCAIFNTSSGVIFFALLFRSNRHLLEQASQFRNSPSYRYFQRTNRANNVLTSITILSEFFLSFLPHFGPLVWEKLFGSGSSMGTGPLSEVMSAFEVFLFSSIYSHFLSVGADTSSGLVGMPDNNRIAPQHSQKPVPSIEVIASSSKRPKTSALMNS